MESESSLLQNWAPVYRASARELLFKLACNQAYKEGTLDGVHAFFKKTSRTR